MFSSHLSHGLTTGLLPWNFPSSSFFYILGLSIRTLWPPNCNIVNLIYFTILDLSNNWLSSLLAYVLVSILSHFHRLVQNFLLVIQWLVTQLKCALASVFLKYHFRAEILRCRSPKSSSFFCLWLVLGLVIPSTLPETREPRTCTSNVDANL
jgi:hypothetical protein